MKKRLILFVLMLLPMLANAYDAYIDGIFYNLFYNLNQRKKEAEVTYNNNNKKSYSGTLAIPTSVTYNGNEYTVTAIGNSAFKDCSDLTSITIPNSVTSIGNGAFSGCI